MSTCIYEAKGGARARGCDAAHEGGRTLGQRIDDAGPLEIPPELLLLGVGALRGAERAWAEARRPSDGWGAGWPTWKAAELSSEAAMLAPHNGSLLGTNGTHARAHVHFKGRVVKSVSSG